MKSLQISLLGWVLIALSIVGLLPFAITAYQITSSQESLIEQVQQTHLVAVISAADRIGGYLELLDSTAESAAKNPNLYKNPSSVEAQEILIGVLRSNNDIAAAGVILEKDDQIDLVQSAQSRQFRAAAEYGLKQPVKDNFQLIKSNNQDWLLVTHPLEQANLSMRLLVKRTKFTELLTIKELEEADLGLFTRSGVRLDGVLGTISNFTEAFREKLSTPQIASSADFFDFSDGSRGVAAFSRIDNSGNWVVISRQPANKAEVAAGLLRKQALIAFGFVALLASLFALAARQKIIKPIRELVEAQKKLVGVDLDNLGGSEIDQLKVAFAKLEQHMTDRKALNKMFLGRYQVVEVIASGAMGTVFKGFDPRLERIVALKTIKIGNISVDFDREQLAQQLVNEAKLIAKIAHPNIITIYDAVDAGESALVAMEFIGGMSLADFIALNKKVAPEQVLALAMGMLRGLSAAHEAGIIHRDIKPGNILLGYDGSIKLTDFGIAELLTNSEENESGHVFGTPGFVAPELITGSGYSQRTDIFAMGALLYQVATQRRPFEGKTVRDILFATRDDTPIAPKSIDPNIPNSLSNLIMFMLQKKPKLRPKDAAVVAEALEQEYGNIKWIPPENSNSGFHSDTSTSAETRMLPETVIRQHLNATDQINVSDNADI